MIDVQSVAAATSADQSLIVTKPIFAISEISTVHLSEGPSLL